MDPSARVYSRFALRLYDFWVLTVSNLWAWRCPTSNTLLPFFRLNLAENAHLDVGVGTGYYLATSARELAKTKSVTLLDLNPNTLAIAESRLRRAGYKGTMEKLEHSILLPLPEHLHSKFDSISVFYVLHCLGGTRPQKEQAVFSGLAQALAPDGVVYGSTILGKGVQHNWFGRMLMRTYNRKGIFGNAEDSLDNLEVALKEYFEDVEVRLVGVVAMFEARKPINK